MMAGKIPKCHESCEYTYQEVQRYLLKQGNNLKCYDEAMEKNSILKMTRDSTCVNDL